MKRKRAKTFGILSALLAGCIAGIAQDYQITSSTASGGGTSAGGGYALTGTVETTTESSLTGGDYSVTSGFLAGVVILQTPSAPTLTIMRAGNVIAISWTSTNSGWTLQSTGGLSSTPTWATATESIIQEDNKRTATITAPPGIRFYRLRLSTPE